VIIPYPVLIIAGRYEIEVGIEFRQDEHLDFGNAALANVAVLFRTYISLLIRFWLRTYCLLLGINSLTIFGPPMKIKQLLFLLIAILFVILSSCAPCQKRKKKP
jgi:hypothetical protein